MKITISDEARKNLLASRGSYTNYAKTLINIYEDIYEKTLDNLLNSSTLTLEEQQEVVITLKVLRRILRFMKSVHTAKEEKDIVNP
jgi:hypothetical protein